MTPTAGYASNIFISYRRRDEPLFAELLAERLRRKNCEVFLDVDSIALGGEWRRLIQEALSDSKCVIVLIGRDWPSERLNDPADVVAYELRVARKFRRVV